MSFENATWLAIVGMGLITYSLRIAGPIFLRGVEPGGSVKLALDAVAPSILIAMVVPSVITSGAPGLVAAALTALAAVRLSLLWAVATGIISVALLRLVFP